MSQQVLENVGEIRRYGKIARKVYYVMNVVPHVSATETTMPVEKGAFLAAIKSISGDMGMTATFDGQDLTVTL